MADYVIPPPTMTVLPVSGGGAFPVRRVFCVGQNYSDHAREMGSDPDRQPPFFFTKPADAVTCAPSVPYPPQTQRLDYEGELVVAIGVGGANFSPDAAKRYIFGYTVGCDLTRRDLQAEAKAGGRPWDMAKGFDFSAAVGVIHPVAEVGHPHKGVIKLTVNDAEKQRGNLSQMIWPVPDILATLSSYVTLAPGDLVFTGTPSGVGPLVRGDKVAVMVEGVTQHKFTVV